jgi:hypothetical protein
MCDVQLPAVCEGCDGAVVCGPVIGNGLFPKDAQSGGGEVIVKECLGVEGFALLLEVYPFLAQQVKMSDCHCESGCLVNGICV